MKWKLYKEAVEEDDIDDDIGDEEEAPFEGIVAKRREYAEPNNDDCMYDEFLKVEGDGSDIEFSTMSGHTADHCTEYEAMANDAAYDWQNRFEGEGDVKDFVLDAMQDQTGEEWEYSEIHGATQGDWAEVLHKVSDRKVLKSLEEDYFGLGDQYDCFDGETGEYMVTVFIPDSLQDQTEEGICDQCGYPSGTEIRFKEPRDW
jgi:hypothetical protein